MVANILEVQYSCLKILGPAIIIYSNSFILKKPKHLIIRQEK